jgi:hypothetical protein
MLKLLSEINTVNDTVTLLLRVKRQLKSLNKLIRFKKIMTLNDKNYKRRLKKKLTLNDKNYKRRLKKKLTLNDKNYKWRLMKKLTPKETHEEVVQLTATLGEVRKEYTSQDIFANNTKKRLD